LVVPDDPAAVPSAWKASDGAGGGAIGLARGSWAEVLNPGGWWEEAVVGADVEADADAVDDSLPALVALDLGGPQ
jgi:hypothetical protein